MKIQNNEALANGISDWLKNYAVSNSINGFVVGISGGIDSSVVSCLCARTGLPTIVVNMPINKDPNNSNAIRHGNWLVESHSNVELQSVDLGAQFQGYCFDFNMELSELAMANTASRLRMVALYAIANTKNMLVVGTGNKVEDMGIGFFTKYGDGGVDISPIGDLMKSEVYELGWHLGIMDEILSSKPTDGLWQDGRDDETQIGATYAELEWAMDTTTPVEFMTKREREVYGIYQKRHAQSAHKMQMPPVFDSSGFRVVEEVSFKPNYLKTNNNISGKSIGTMNNIVGQL